MKRIVVISGDPRSTASAAKRWEKTSNRHCIAINVDKLRESISVAVNKQEELDVYESYTEYVITKILARYYRRDKALVIIRLKDDEENKKVTNSIRSFALATEVQFTEHIIKRKTKKCKTN